MKASYLGAMGYSGKHNFPPTWPVPPAYDDPATSVLSYQEGIEECEFAEEMGFEWVSFSEHHYSGRIATGVPAVMAAAVAERCKKVKIAMLGHVLPLNNPVRVAEELGLLDNLTNGRLIIGFLRGTATEDQTYTMDPSEGRGRLMEGMDLVLKALTEPQPFGWEGRHYNFRTVAVWPRPVQQPLPPVIVATRSEDSAQYAAKNKLGLGVSFVPSEMMAGLTEKYYSLVPGCRLDAPARTGHLPGQYLLGRDGQAGRGVDGAGQERRGSAGGCCSQLEYRQSSAGS